MPADPERPITVALVDDYDVVLIGLAHLFDDYRDRVVVAEIDANNALRDDVDIVLYDAYAQPESDHNQVGETDQHHVVVVDEGDRERPLRVPWHRGKVHPSGCSGFSAFDGCLNTARMSGGRK